MAVAPNLGVAFVLAVPLGMGGAGYIASTNGILLPRVRADMRGRVLALQATAFLGSTPIGGPITGWIGDHFGAGWSIAYGGLIVLACGRGGRRLHREPAAIGGRSPGRDTVGAGPGPAERRGRRAGAVSTPRSCGSRRDLRLADHPALCSAADAPAESWPCSSTIPCVRWVRARHGGPGYAPASRRRLSHSIGGALVIRRGDPVEVVPAHHRRGRCGQCPPDHAMQGRTAGDAMRR